MITLTDYLNYLNQQFVDARFQADRSAIVTARTYAADEYLRHFKVPRFTMPVIKLKVPIKIDAVNQETTYDFALKEEDFIGRINKRFHEIGNAIPRRISPFGKKEFNNPALVKYLKELQERNLGFISNIDHAISRDRIDEVYLKIYPQGTTNGSLELPLGVKKELRAALFDALKAQFQPRITNINNLAVTPQANGLNQDDSDKLLIHLELEMVEESIQLRKITNEDGEIIEEIIVD